MLWLHYISVFALKLYSILDKIFSRHFEIYFLFFIENRFRYFMQIVDTKCLILFSGKNKKNIFNLSSTEFAHKMVNVKSVLMCNWKAQRNGNQLFQLMGYSQKYFSHVKTLPRTFWDF